MADCPGLNLASRGTKKPGRQRAGRTTACPVLHQRRQLDDTCQVPLRDFTKPYDRATAGLPKISGWNAGLTPTRLQGSTDPPRSLPLLRPLSLSDSNKVAELMVGTPKAMMIASTPKGLFPLMPNLLFRMPATSETNNVGLPNRDFWEDCLSCRGSTKDTDLAAAGLSMGAASSSNACVDLRQRSNAVCSSTSTRSIRRSTSSKLHAHATVGRVVAAKQLYRLVLRRAWANHRPTAALLRPCSSHSTMACCI